MSSPKQGMAQRLNAGQLAIVNSLSNPEIQELVAQFGYPAAKLEAGRALYESALAAVNASTVALGGQQASTQALVQAEKSARDAYQSLAKVARAVFGKDKAQLTALGLSGAAPKNTAGFTTAAYTLFDNARSAPLAEYGYDPDRLQNERAKVAAYDEANRGRQPRERRSKLPVSRIPPCKPWTNGRRNTSRSQRWPCATKSNCWKRLASPRAQPKPPPNAPPPKSPLPQKRQRRQSNNPDLRVL
jgi:hypothetical protein